MITSNTNLYCVIGNPIKHSKSPIIHNFIFEKIGVDAVYLAFEIKNLQVFFDFVRDVGVKGVSITIPHKLGATKLVDKLDEFSSKIGAINTIKNDNGILIGYNTDVQGVVKSFETRGINTLENKTALLIGNGGVAKSVAWAFWTMKVGRIIVAGRNTEKLVDFANEVKKYFSEVEVITLDRINDVIKRVDVISNCTPVGMFPNVDETPIDLTLVSEEHIVFDTIYNPIDTKLITHSRNIGARIVYGIDMFVFQALEQDRIWFDNPQVYSFKDAVINLLNHSY
ncbi:MAG: shikimate dehydrogenase [Spirochaetes bacterium]|nr:shikimate dehydrogenase [Spirochaetota bacterium]